MYALLILHTNTLYTFTPYLIMWNSKKFYIIDPNIVIYIKQLMTIKNIRFIILY
jgi:hypothetical protein